MEFQVDAGGRVLASRVVESSGFRSLDSAAATSLSKCHFRPATRDGVAEESWARVRFAWKLPR
jgi:protein TonB